MQNRWNYSREQSVMTHYYSYFTRLVLFGAFSNQQLIWCQVTTWGQICVLTVNIFCLFVCF